MLILLLINLLRLNPLILDDHLSQLATQRAEIVYSDWSHNNWKTSFKDTDCAYQGENLAKNFNDVQAFLAWYNSPKHKDNMFNEKYTKIGIGYYKNVTVNLFCGYGKL
jgi:uncharacterized protein YkwD